MGSKHYTLKGAALIASAGFVSNTPAMIEAAKQGIAAHATNSVVASSVIENGLIGTGHIFGWLGHVANFVSHVIFGGVHGALGAVATGAMPVVAASAGLGILIADIVLVGAACFLVGMLFKKICDKVRHARSSVAPPAVTGPQPEVQSRSNLKQNELGFGTHPTQAQVLPRAQGGQSPGLSPG